MTRMTADERLQAEYRDLDAFVRPRIWAWDPLGVADIAPPDEYDYLIGKIMGALHRDASTESIARLLRAELTEYFGIRATGSVDAVAAELSTWKRP